MTLHIIAWAFHITALHSMSFRGPELLISKFSIQIRISTLFKIDFKTLGLQNYQFFPFYPQDSEFQNIFSGKQSGYFQYGFQPLHLRFCPFDNFKYLPFTKSPYRGQLFPKIPVLPISPDFMKIPKRGCCFILISIKKQCGTHTEVVSHRLFFWKFEFWKTQKYRSLVPWIGATCPFSLLPFYLPSVSVGFT